MSALKQSALACALFCAFPVHGAITTLQEPRVLDIAHNSPNFVRHGFVAEGRSGQYQHGEIIARYWLRNQVKIPNVTSKTYTPSRTDIGKQLIYVEEVRDRRTGEVTVVKSKPVVVKADTIPSQRSFPAIIAERQNTVQSGQTIRATAGSYHNGVIFERIWYIDGKVVARGASYRPSNADVGKKLVYSERVRNNQGEISAFYSAPVSIVASTVTPPTPPASTDICHSIVAQNRPLISTKTVDPLPDIPQPVLYKAMESPYYRTCMVRLSDRAKEGGLFRRNHYSRLQAFNADSSYMLLNGESGHWYLYNAQTARPIKMLTGLAADIEPQWHPSNPNIFYHIDNVGYGMRFYQRDVEKNQSTLLADFGARIKARWPSAIAASTKSEGSPSADSRYWCFVVQNIPVPNGAWKQIGVFTWDRQTDTILAMMDVNVPVDHVSMSPSGRYCVVSSDDKTMGTRAYTRTFDQYVQLLHKSEHSDIALDKNGHDVYVSVDYQHNDGYVFMYNIDKKQRINLFPLYAEGTGTALHFSGKAYKKPGWVLVSTYAERNNRTNSDDPLRNDPLRQWHHRKIFAVSLEANPQIRVISYADAGIIPNVPAPNYFAWEYFSEPQATVNQDFTRILFNSSWASEQPNDLAAYMSVISADAVK